MKYFQDFKCHREILANASNPFSALFSNKPAKGPDEPIVLKNVDEYTFTSIMR
jgi:BTB/POZ domain